MFKKIGFSGFHFPAKSNNRLVVEEKAERVFISPSFSSPTLELILHPSWSERLVEVILPSNPLELTISNTEGFTVTTKKDVKTRVLLRCYHYEWSIIG